MRNIFFIEENHIEGKFKTLNKIYGKIIKFEGFDYLKNYNKFYKPFKKIFLFYDN